MCTTWLIAALCVLVPQWKLPKHSSPGEWINNLWYTQTNGLLYSKLEGGQATVTCKAVDKVRQDDVE